MARHEWCDVSLVTATLEAGVLTVTMSDEENRNALSQRLLGELTLILDDADSNPDVRVVVLTNTGKVFCAGADLKASGEANPATPATSELFGRFWRSPKPYIGRIDGHCVAGGMGIAAAMDISVAREDVQFGFSEVRVGVSPAMIANICLRKMRMSHAREFFLRGTRFSAQRAAFMGLINAAVPAEDLDETVAAIVADVVQGGPNALAATKQVLANVPDMTFEQATAWTAELSAAVFASDEAREGMTAFLEKRRPSWVVSQASSSSTKASESASSESSSKISSDD